MINRHLAATIEVLDARIRIEERELANSQQEKDRLRKKQLALIQESEIAREDFARQVEAGLVPSFATSAFVARQHRMKTKLQPALAKAALERAKIDEALRKSTRQRLSLSLELNRRDKTDQKQVETLFLLKHALERARHRTS